VLVLAGSPGKVGAALLVAHGALRGGAGLVTLAAVPEVTDALDRRVLEAMTARLDPSKLEASLDALLEKTDAVAIGPGLGFDETARRLVRHVVLGAAKPIVVDADAITHFKDSASELAGAAGSLILTPHSGEMSRILGNTASEVDADRFGSVQRAAELTRATVLLKGPHTLVAAPGRAPIVGSAGSPVLATGGAGDSLTGIIAALACRLEGPMAAYSGAFLHARAGELWAARVGSDRGLLAHEISDALPQALAELSAAPSTLTL
jgi:NAD(P)H-hydrate epimerase